MLILLTVLLFVSCFGKKDNGSFADLFAKWSIQFNKTYATAQERSARFTNFMLSVHRINTLNEKFMGQGATYGLNMFSDLSVEEFRAFYLLNKPIIPKKKHAEAPIDKPMAFPQVWDWRTESMVTPVKNQAQCGSCWAFSATETIESAWLMKYKPTHKPPLPPLSPQQIVDCDTMDGGCNGGNPDTAYQYVINAGGIEPVKFYPYTGQDGTCNFNKSDVFTNIATWAGACGWEDETALTQSTYTYGPLSICVDAANWQDYTGGIMTAWQCAWVNVLDHCVQAVGWNLSAPVPFWIVRNSWTTGWGEAGYIRLQYGHNTCGLTNQATYVTVV